MLNLLSKRSLQQCLLIEQLRTKNITRNYQAKNIKTAKCEKAVGLIGWLGLIFKNVLRLLFFEKTILKFPQQFYP